MMIVKMIKISESIVIIGLTDIDCMLKFKTLNMEHCCTWTLGEPLLVYGSFKSAENRL